MAGKAQSDSVVNKLLVALAITSIAVGVTAAFARTPVLDRAVAKFDDVFYDWFYRSWRRVDRTVENGDVVVIAVDDVGEKRMGFGWPWPRDLWGQLVTYLDKAGAKVVVFDLLFEGRSQYQDKVQDDDAFADALDGAKVPVRIATVVNTDGTTRPFAPPVRRPVALAAADVIDETTVRHYDGTKRTVPSLAVAAVTAAGRPVPQWANGRFRLHYYGPYHTFTYVRGSNAVLAAFKKLKPADGPLDPAIFKDKIVVIGTISAGGFDQKASPTADVYPGVEIQATAIQNLLRGDRVVVAGAWTLWPLTFAVVWLAAAAGVLFRRAWLKIVVGLVLLCLVVTIDGTVFSIGNHVRFFTPTAPLLATTLATVMAVGYSYLIEDRQARFFIKALSQYVSPHVAAELRDDPTKLSLGTESRELTILFSDVVGFTPLAERLGDRIGTLLNAYLDEMTAPVFETDGVVDKYIGDAIMAFWNAPLLQADHAARACRTALAMRRRLLDIRPKLVELGAPPDISMRIGVHTGLAAFGNMGSPRFKFDYSVIGDTVNFASRLEGANKQFGSTILIGETTAAAVAGQFAMRKLDLLRVVGKARPVAVYELLDGPTDRIEMYESAFTAYQNRDWPTAERFLFDLVARYPDDGPAAKLLARVGRLKASPPPADWDGVFVASEK